MGRINCEEWEICPPRIVHKIVHIPKTAQNSPGRPKNSRIRKNIGRIRKKMVAIGRKATIFRRVGARRFELLTFCTPSPDSPGGRDATSRLSQ